MDYSNFIGKECVVRARDASPHFGIVTGIDGRTVSMKDARRLWRWQVLDKKGFSLSEVAAFGISQDWSRVSVPVSDALIQDACEVLLCTDEAAATLRAIEAYKP